MEEESEFKLIEVEEPFNINGKTVLIKGFRLVHKVTLKQYGEYFQAQCRSLEWRAALIIHEKYRRKYNLNHEDLLSLINFSEITSERRIESGKPINKDFLIQQISAELKRRITEKNVKETDPFQEK